MSSERQIRANRLNAQRSTGPSSSDGKARVASNPLKHGLTAKRIVLPSESAEEFEAFRIALWDDLDPKGALEEVLAEKIVADAWRLRRVPVLEAALHERDLQQRSVERIRKELNSMPILNENDPNLVTASNKLDQPALRVAYALEKHLNGFVSLWRHEEALTRSLRTTLHELQRLQAIRVGELVPAPAVLDVNINSGSPESCET